MPFSDHLRGTWDKARAILLKVGAVQTKVILTVLYFLVGAPVALVMRLIRRHPLAADPEENSHWCDRPHEERSLENFMRQY